MAKLVGVVASAALFACGAPQVQGSATLDVQPTTGPTFAGQYDFDLLGPARGSACVATDTSALSRREVEVWTGAFALARGPADARARHAIAEASIDAIDRVAGADTILVTRVITDTGRRGEICAWVYGRGVRLTKAGARADAPPAPPADEAPAPGEPRDDAADDATDGAADGAADAPEDAAEPAPALDVFDTPRPPRR